MTKRLDTVARQAQDKRIEEFGLSATIDITLRRPQTALEQIAAHLDLVLQNNRARDLVVKVGQSAAWAIKCQTSDRQLPNLIKGVPVQFTEDFNGWEVYRNGRAME